jgi:hypothetical protein
VKAGQAKACPTNLSVTNRYTAALSEKRANRNLGGNDQLDENAHLADLLKAGDVIYDFESQPASNG